MTTREENLKKINDELEKLDDEQLEEIAGGDKSDKKIITPEDLGIPPLIPKIKIGDIEEIAGGDKSDKKIITPEDLGIPPLVTVPIPKIKIGDIKIDFPKSKKKQELPEYLIIKK